jgi:hypothetical protein
LSGAGISIFEEELFVEKSGIGVSRGIGEVEAESAGGRVTHLAFEAVTEDGLDLNRVVGMIEGVWHFIFVGSGVGGGRGLVTVNLVTKELLNGKMTQE